MSAAGRFFMSDLPSDGGPGHGAAAETHVLRKAGTSSPTLKRDARVRLPFGGRRGALLMEERLSMDRFRLLAKAVP